MGNANNANGLDCRVLHCSSYCVVFAKTCDLLLRKLTKYAIVISSQCNSWQAQQAHGALHIDVL